MVAAKKLTVLKVGKPDAYEVGLKAIQHPRRGKQGAWLSLSISRHNKFTSLEAHMTGTTAKAQLLDLLLDPLRGCAGLYTYRQQLMTTVMEMPPHEVNECLEHLHRTNFPGT